MLQEAKSGIPPQEKLEIKGATIPDSRVSTPDGTVFYIVNVRGSFNSWCIQKRFSQFEELHNHAATLTGFPRNLLPPPKRYRWFTSHIAPTFIEERRILLENYLKRILGSYAKDETVVRFLTTDKCQEKSVKAEKEGSVKLSAAALPDDVEVTGISMSGAPRVMTDHVLYQIDCVNARKRRSFSKWTVLKRFGQFYEMDCAVRASFAEKLDVLAKLPPPPLRRAKLFTDHGDPAFVEQRRVVLEHYLQHMIVVLDVVRHRDFLAFLGVNVNNSDGLER